MHHPKAGFLSEIYFLFDAEEHDCFIRRRTKMIGENCDNATGLQPKHHLCVISGIAKADSSGSVIYGMDLSKDQRIEGQPFRLHQENGRYIWPNERIAAEKLKQRSIVKYQVFGDISTYLGGTKRSMVSLNSP